MCKKECLCLCTIAVQEHMGCACGSKSLHAHLQVFVECVFVTPCHTSGCADVSLLVHLSNAPPRLVPHLLPGPACTGHQFTSCMHRAFPTPSRHFPPTASTMARC